MSAGLSLVESLETLDACPEAVTWAGQFASFRELWDACPHAEWIIWCLEKINYQNERGLRTFAVACARHHWNLLLDERSKRAVEVADKFNSNLASTNDLRLARAAAQAAASDGALQANWTAASAAAALTAYHTVRPTGFMAARAASKSGISAIAWDSSNYSTADQEDFWQADQLRLILGSEAPRIIDQARATLRQLQCGGKTGMRPYGKHCHVEQV